MELPKNITQIGESDRSCKIYVEDYVISYMKQMNLLAQNKDMAVALYGVRKEENEVSYLFLYGACKLDFLQRESRHLSQAQQQEIERLRKKYFADYQFMGYRLLNGEMIEGFHICEQGVCRYVSGYAQFYEKNDSMLAYMLDTRQEGASPEEVDQEKYNIVRQRQEERRAKAEEKNGASFRTERKKAKKDFSGNLVSAEAKKDKHAEKSLRKFRFSAAAVFAVLCVAGLAAMSGSERVEEMQQAARELMAEMTEQKLPDSIESLPDSMEAVSATGQVDVIVAEDKLSDALQKENADAGKGTASTDSAASDQTSSMDSVPPSQDTASSQQSAGTGTTEEQQEPLPEEPLPEETQQQEPQQQETPQEETASAQTSAETSGPVAYVIQKGDTLIGISIRQYGTDAKVSEICELNQIANPDDIKVGEKILLP